MNGCGDSQQAYQKVCNCFNNLRISNGISSHWKDRINRRICDVFIYLKVTNFKLAPNEKLRNIVSFGNISNRIDRVYMPLADDATLS